MIELPLILLSGTLGSAHCIGMCGPFAVTIGATTSGWRNNLHRQMVYGVGRIFTYSFLGACAGLGGWTLTQGLDSNSATRWTAVPAVMSIVAGGFLIYQGLLAVGIIRARAVRSHPSSCLSASLLASYLRAGRPGTIFFAGVFTGLLPCGLVYGFLAVAASSGSVVTGLLSMACFGVGTLPVMLVAGVGGGSLRWSLRSRVMRISAWAVVLTGLICVARGVGFLPLIVESNSCVFCGH